MENIKDKTRQDKQDGQDIILSVAMENEFSILQIEHVYIS